MLKISYFNFFYRHKKYDIDLIVSYLPIIFRENVY